MIYLTNALSKPMYPNLVKGNCLVIGDNFNIEYLRDLSDYRVCINNQALINTLELNLGIELASRLINKVSLVPGDRVLVINPSERIETLKENDYLPDNITFKLEEVLVEK